MIKQSIYVFVLFLTVISLYLGSNTYEHTYNNESFDLYNYTQEYFNWDLDTVIQEFENKNENDHITLNISNDTDSQIILSQRINNIYLKLLDCFGYISFEYVKICFTKGYESKGAYSDDYMIFLLKLVIWGFVIVFLFKPVMYVILFIYVLIKKYFLKN